MVVDHVVAEGPRSSEYLALYDVLPESPLDFLGQIRRIILGETLHDRFHDDAVGALDVRFGGGEHFYAVAFEDRLVLYGVGPSSGESVLLPNDHGVEALVFALPYHSLEVWPFISSGRFSSIDVFTDYLISLSLTKSSVVPPLSLYRLLGLVFAREPEIEDGPDLALLAWRPLPRKAQAFRIRHRLSLLSA